MGKYQHTLNMDTDNSAALILKRVMPNSKVLEFGPGNGYMTQYLKETLGCATYIVEIDSDMDAYEYADHSMVGPLDGDIEKYNWCGAFSGPFDYIIFADVLEHLKDPWEALKRAKDFLSENGSILISIPHIGHNSVIIDLINGKFNYRELGLLDNTHLRFFTRESLLKMVTDAGLQVVGEYNTYCAVEHTEFKNSMDDIPIELVPILTARPDGILYQFVWELKR